MRRVQRKDPSWSALAVQEQTQIDEVRDKWSQAANQGYEKAQFDLAVMFDLGQGTPSSYEDAVKWYQKAAAQ
jgi:TPR repeat protein